MSVLTFVFLFVCMRFNSSCFGGTVTSKKKVVKLVDVKDETLLIDILGGGGV